MLFVTTYGQDIIIKINGDEIQAKVLEVGLSIVKYKKFDNINGPTFEILKSDIFMIRYPNGTKDVFNQPDGEKSTQYEPKKPKKDNTLSFTEKHKSTSLFYGLSALLGLGSFSAKDESGSAGFKSFAIGPVSLIANKGLSDKFSLHYGPSLMYYIQEVSFSSGYYDSRGIFRTTTERSTFNLLLLAGTVGINYHFGTTKKIDPYVGISGGVGYYVGLFGGNGSNSGENLSVKGSVPFIYGTKVGMNILNKNNNAWSLELGYDYLSYLKIGYTFINHK